MDYVITYLKKKSSACSSNAFKNTLSKFLCPNYQIGQLTYLLGIHKFFRIDNFVLSQVLKKELLKWFHENSRTVLLIFEFI